MHLCAKCIVSCKKSFISLISPFDQLSDVMHLGLILDDHDARNIYNLHDCMHPTGILIETRGTERMDGCVIHFFDDIDTA